MRNAWTKRLMALVLVFAMVAAYCLPASAVEDEIELVVTQVGNDAVSAGLPSEQIEKGEAKLSYKDDDVVRVSIVLEKSGTLDAGFDTDGIADNAAAKAYRSGLKNDQKAVERRISSAALNGEKLDVVWNLTLAANIISANVPFGTIDKIKAVDGVSDVLIETRYDPAVVSVDETADPNMSTSSAQIGSNVAYAEGLTGAGSRIAVVDTGTDDDHELFQEAGFLYALQVNAEAAGMSYDEYVASLDLLDAEEIASKLDQLNIAPVAAKNGYTAEDLCLSAKLPFAFNYIDENLTTNHDSDDEGEHGSHVAGIATANRFKAEGDGFVAALDTVHTQGVAPDAQLITMKVFGAGGGAYDSDYMAAIEDAIVLGCDSVNLSLGSGNPGLSRPANEAYAAIMDNLVNSNTVVTMSAGNASYWAEQAYNPIGYLYGDGVSFSMTGTPGTYTNSLSVASVDNDGYTGAYLAVGDAFIFYTESSGYSNPPISTTLSGEQEYIMFQNTGVDADGNNLFTPYADLVSGKIAICSRGDSSFYQKMDAAAQAGAIGCIIVNNQPGTINMDLSDATSTIPCVSITLADGDVILGASEENTAEDGTVYYTGKIDVGSDVASVAYDADFYTMSDFSSWGVPGSLEMKPEITAPGGNIYSVNGAIAGGTSYESMSGTSMAAPQVAGMAAVVAQYIRENGLAEKTGLSVRTLSNSLLMSTAVPIVEDFGENGSGYYPVIRQGSGLANVGAAVTTKAYILMDEEANAGAADGKVKVELGDDPDREGVYSFSFSINNLSEEDLAYDLSCETFTQDMFAYYVNEDNDVGRYLDTQTAPLAANVSWTVDGEPVRFQGDIADNDVNMDGVVDTEDVRALLAWLAGDDIEIDEFAIDVDGDGEMTTRDARALLLQLSTGSITVPASGSVNVDVTIALTQSEKDYLDTNYNSGAYVEAYVFATPVTEEDGAEGVTLSIPVLGYYGSWTDGSMYDVGTAVEYGTGVEVRDPYVGDMTANALGITYADDSESTYYFGTNPVTGFEGGYYPERASVNTERGDMFSLWTACLIRNSSGGRFTITNAETGEVLTEKAIAGGYGAYYRNSSSSAGWTQTKVSYSLNAVIPEAEEGTELAISLTHAPEYYVQEDGSIDFDALGEGASMTFGAVVDNTAPVLEDVSLSLVNNTLRVTASDNRYVAGALLYNSTGKKFLAGAGVGNEAMAEGDTVTLDIDLANVSGDSFLLQVVDYAMNVTTFQVSMGLGGEEVELPTYIAYDLDDGNWVSFNKESTHKTVETYAEAPMDIMSGTIVDHYVFFEGADGFLYVMPEDDFSEPIAVNNLGVDVTDMAYCEDTDLIYGVAENYLVSIDKLTGELSVIGKIGVSTTTLACDAKGNFYCNELGTSNICTFTLDTIAQPTQVASAGNFAMRYLQSMEIDPNTGELVWTSYYVDTYGYAYLITMDTETYEVTLHNDLWNEFSALLIPAKSGAKWDAATDKVEGLILTVDSVDLIVGNSMAVGTVFQPWTVSDRSVTWSVENEEIATVTADGVVTGVAEGTTKVIATSKLDPSISAEATVNVSTVKATLRGALQNVEGNPVLYEWNLATDKTWTATADLGHTVESSTLDTLTGDVYVVDAEENSWAVHKINGETGETKETFSNAIGLPLWDIAYSTKFSSEDAPLIHAIYNYYLMPCKDPSALDTSAFGLSSYLSQYTGASYLVACASGGPEVVQDSKTGELVDTEAIYMLDNKGYMWLFNIYASETGMSAYISYADTGLGAYEGLAGYSDYDIFTSMAMDQQGNFFVSVFNDKSNTNTVYMVCGDMDNGYETVRIGDFGDGVWPATINEIENHDVEDVETVTRVVSSEMQVSAAPVSPAELEAAKDSFAASAIARVDNSGKTASVEQAVTGSLNAVTGSVEKKSIDKKDVDNADTIDVEITLGQEAGNGLYYFEFDNGAVEFVGVDTDVELYGIHTEDNWVAFSFASEELYAEGTTIATLKFKVIAAVEAADFAYSVMEEADEDWVDAGEFTVDVCPTRNFNDVGRDTWYHDAVDFVNFHGIMTGTGANTFSPEGTLSRAQMVTVLYRMAGSPEYEAVANNFTDVKSKHWFYNEVMWAASAGLTNGTSATTFSPNKAVTRSELVTFLARFVDADVDAAEYDLSAFKDSNTIKSYAVKNMTWALENGLLHFEYKTILAPNQAATRADAAFAIMALAEQR